MAPPDTTSRIEHHAQTSHVSTMQHDTIIKMKLHEKEQKVQTRRHSR